MFPLVHFYVNKNIYNQVPHLMALGALYPDLATSVGIDRNYAHSFGSNFHAWCKENAPSGIPLAQGIISHGVNPKCVDYYADEFWPGYRKGWCFMLGEAYLNQVAQVTKLPPDLIWWKAHNFVEISYELIINTDHPWIKDDLNSAVEDHNAIQEAAEILSAYHGISSQKIKNAFTDVPSIFTLHEISAFNFANEQKTTFRLDHQIFDANPDAMAELFLQISQDLLPGFYPYIEEVIAKTALVLRSF